MLTQAVPASPLVAGWEKTWAPIKGTEAFVKRYPCSLLVFSSVVEAKGTWWWTLSVSRPVGTVAHRATDADLDEVRMAFGFHDAEEHTRNEGVVRFIHKPVDARLHQRSEVPHGNES